MAERPTPKEGLTSFKDVAIVGYGATGKLYFKQLYQTPLQSLNVVASKHLSADDPKSLERVIEQKPQLLILATPNPADAVLKKIARLAPDGMTIVLPQNGVAVVDTAMVRFQEAAKNIHIVRASLITAVAQNDKGDLMYNTKKMPRIAFAQVGQHGPEVDAVADLFQSAGFKTKVIEDYVAMEWTKLLTNTIGSTALVTGLSPRETFRNQEYFEKEVRALKDRLMILKAAGIELVDLPGVPTSLFKLMQKLPIEILLRLTPLRNQIAEYFAAHRNNLPPASRKQILDGKKPEAIYYHQPFVELGKTVGLPDPTDEALDYLLSFTY